MPCGPLWWASQLVNVYVYAHLGLSFLLSAILATPGCEMRAIPHLAGILTRAPAREHYCPGFLDNVDRWERARHSPQSGDTEEHRGAPGLRSGELLGGSGLLLYYGVPFLALLLSGNLGNARTLLVVWTLSFLAMGLAGLANAWRCQRVHCYFTGPWFLLAAAATLLHGLGAVDFGPRGGTWILYGGLGGALMLYFITEGFWGKYFGRADTDTPD